MGLFMYLHVRALALAISILAVASHFALAEDKAEADLLTLAWNQFKDEIATYSGEERKVFEKFFKNVQQGRWTILRPENQFFILPKEGEWGEDQTIRAKWI